LAAHIRLKRIGKTKRPYYRIVVLDSRAPRDGACLETLGYYQPIEKQNQFKLDFVRYEDWLSKGAKVSGIVKSIAKKLRKSGPISEAAN
jgi:small subunit ribosomal protein S16